MANRRAIFVTVLCLVVILLAGCGSNTFPLETGTQEPFYTRVSEAVLSPGDNIPLPTSKTVLTVSGKIGASQVENTIEMDIETIESVGQVEYRVTDPFLEKSIVYRGVLMDELLAVLQLDEDATKLDIRALNDYTITISIEEFKKYPVLFAMEQDGKYMSISDRGPAMLVFPYDNFEFDHDIYENYWIWQIAEIVVK